MSEYTITIKIKDIPPETYDISVITNRSISEEPDSPSEHAALRVFQAIEREFREDTEASE